MWKSEADFEREKNAVCDELEKELEIEDHGVPKVAKDTGATTSARGPSGRAE